MKKAISEWVCAIALAIPLAASAAPFSVTYTDTISSVTGFFTDINTGEQAQVKIVFDNGGSSSANQTWTAANVQCVIFTFNNAGNKFAAINYAATSFSTATTGTFTTNGAGQLQAGTIDWEDQTDPVIAPNVNNIAGVTSGVGNWILNGTNRVVDFNLGEINFTNVVNDPQVTHWSNPTSANGVCANFFTPTVPQAAVPMPTLNLWGMVVLSSLIALAAVLGLRRYHA